jgi:hypothetical protein
MTFDVYLLDELDWDDEDVEEKVEQYQDEILELFANSPEGKEYLEVNPEMGFWIDQLIYYGYGYEDCTITSMDQSDLETILLSTFPRKISTFSPDDTKQTIPELIAFWKYLKREYRLDNADEILELLDEIEPDFQEAMNNTDNFGIAKSFFMAGNKAGFDMTDEDGMKQFMALYNAQLSQKEVSDSPSSFSDMLSSFGTKKSSQSKKSNLQDILETDEMITKSKVSKTKKKAKAKMAKTSRKKNRK